MWAYLDKGNFEVVFMDSQVHFRDWGGEGVEGEVKGRGREEGREEWGRELVEVTDSCETDHISHTIQ